MKEKEMKETAFACPMKCEGDKTYTKEGKCPKCGMDLKEVKNITEISARFLQDQRSWILMPTKVDYYISEDNVNFTYFGSVNNTLDPKVEENTILNFTSNETKGKKARYVKVIAKNFGKLPEWHQGAGGDAFIFIDEITIK